MTKGINPILKTVLFILIIGYGNMIYGQQETMVLRVIQVLDSLEEQQKSKTSFNFDSLQYMVANGIDGGEFVNRNTGIYVKDYGPGSTSTLSYRGNSASHTKVYWEGISVDNEMLGQSDLSLVSFNKNVTMDFLKAGNSLSLGSGGFGGILNVSSGNDKWKGSSVDAGISYGSFNTKIIPVNFFLGNSKLKLESFLTYSSSDNNYIYTNYLDGNKKETIQNSAFQKVQFLPKISFKLNKNNEFSLAYWYAESERQVPGVIGTPHGDAVQKDLWNRAMFRWKNTHNKMTINFTSAITNDEMLYENRALNINSENFIRSSKNLLNIRLKLPKSFVSESQVKFDLIEVESNNYDGIKEQRIFSLYEAISYQKKRFFAKPGLRVESPDKDKLYLMPSFNLGYAPMKNIAGFWLYGSAAYNVRYPTFNERFWLYAGNPDLREEESKSTEIGIENTIKKSKDWNIKVLITAYHSEITNLIAWAPDKSTIWIPQNISEVENNGMEIEGKANWKRGNWIIYVQAGYSYTSSTVTDNKEYPDNIGKQQIYIAPHKIQGTFNISWKNNFLSYNQVYTGETFVTTDNNTFLPYNAPATIEIGRKIFLKESMISTSFKINNLFDEDYQYVLHRPMPLRNYQLSILYHFN